MAKQTPDVRVRLSAEGVQDVVRAFEAIQAAAEKAKKEASKGGGAGLLKEEFGGLKEMLPELTVAAVAGGFAELTKTMIESAVAVGDMHQKTGLAVDTLSLFRFAAQQAGQDQEAMNQNLIRSVRFFDQYDQGAQQAHDTVKNLFGNENALKGLTDDQRLLKVTNALAKLEPGAKRTGAAIEIFGRQGADLLPVLDKLGSGGMDELRKKAQKLGGVFNQQLVDAATRAAEQWKNLTALAQGAALQFAAGIAPALANAVETITDDLSQAGVDGFQGLGQGAGKVITAIVAGFLIVGKTIAFVIEEAELLFHNFRETAKDDIKGIWSEIKAAAGALTGDVTRFLNKADADRLTAPGGNQFLGRLKAFGADISKTLDKLFNAPSPTHRPGTPDRSTETVKQLMAARTKLIEAQLDAEIAILKAKNQLAENEEKHRYDQGLVSIEKYYKDRAARINAEADKEIALLTAKRDAVVKAINFEATRKLDKGESEDTRTKNLLALRAELAKANADIKVADINRQKNLGDNTADQLTATRELAKAQLEAEAQIDEAQGRRFDAEQKHLEAEVAGLERLKGESDEAFAKRQGTLLTTGTQKIDFEKLQNNGKLALDALATARQKINDEVASGQLDQLNAEDRIRAAEKARLPQLQAIAEAMQAAAVTPEQIQAANEFAESINQIGIASDKAAQQSAQLKQALEQGLNEGINNFFNDLSDGAHSVSDAFRDMALGVVKAVQQMVQQMIVAMITAKLMKAIFGGGDSDSGFSGGGQVDASGGVNAATGGEIHGPGTGTSDSIPAWLSDGEFVVRSAVVSQPGVLSMLHALNRGGAGAFSVRGRSRYAEGGLVAGTGTTSQGPVGKAGLSATLELDEGLVLKKLSASPEWDRVHVKTAERNAKAVKSVLGA